MTTVAIIKTHLNGTCSNSIRSVYKDTIVLAIDISRVLYSRISFGQTKEKITKNKRKTIENY